MPAMRNTNSPRSRAYRAPEHGAPTRQITMLPASGCKLPVPTIPKTVKDAWSPEQKRRWKELWQSPQATQWDESYSGTVALLVAYESKLLTGDGSAWMAQEARYAADALGLTPKAMNALGWRIGMDGGDEDDGKQA